MSADNHEAERDSLGVHSRTGRSLPEAGHATATGRHRHQTRVQHPGGAGSSARHSSTAAATMHTRAARDTRVPTAAHACAEHQSDHHLGQAVAAAAAQSDRGTPGAHSAQAAGRHRRALATVCARQAASDL